MSIQQIYEKYHNEVEFINIYIREAHPVDGWWLGRRLTKGTIKKWFPKVSLSHYDPTTMDERREVANDCVHTLDLGIRTYVDDLDDRVNRTYAAWPTRFYFIGLDGKVVYAGGLGPYGFIPSRLENAITDYLEAVV